MADTPSHRLTLTPSNSPHLSRPLRSRGRPPSSHLALRRVIGTTCGGPNGFDTVGSSFAYIAGGAVVVVDVVGDNSYAQRFYRARPTAVPIYPTSNSSQTSSSPNVTPRANDSRNRVAPGHRDSTYSPIDWPESPSRTWTSRERIKSATCLALSRDGKYLAVGETGYAPRVLIFSLQEASSDIPLVSISEHSFGVNCVAWSPDTKYLASLGSANDGFLYVWKIDPRTGAAKLFQQNRCTSYVRDMLWVGNCLVTLGQRHVKMWKIEEPPAISPTKARFLSEQGNPTTPQKTLPGRNVLLGSLLDATFTCAAVDGKRLLICTEAGDLCILDDDDRQAKLCKVLNVNFSITSIAIREKIAYISGKGGKFATLDVDAVMDGQVASVLATTESSIGLIALGFLESKLVTINCQQSIDVWSSTYLPGTADEAMAHIPISGHGEPILGCQSIDRPNSMDADFMTWSADGNVLFWDLDGRTKRALEVPLDTPPNDIEYEPNQLACVRATLNGSIVATVDQMGILKVTNVESGETLLNSKAHSSRGLSVSIFEENDRLLMATCGRDRVTQLFHSSPGTKLEHFQTLEFAAKVVQVVVASMDMVITCSLDRTLQVHEIVAKEDENESLAAIPSTIITLKASPTAMVMGQDNKDVYVALLDRTVCQFDVRTGRQISCYKCMDEHGIESAVLESLSLGSWPSKEAQFLLATSNTDKSIRLYDAQSGNFLDREWGHTEAIHGVTLVQHETEGQKAVSVGSDGTIMIWALDLADPVIGTVSRDPSPAKDITPCNRPTLRKVLSKSELADFPRPQSPLVGRRSPPRQVRRRTSRFGLNATPSNPKTPNGVSGKNLTVDDGTPSRAENRSSPPSSPRRGPRRPSLAVHEPTVRKKTSSSSLRGMSSLNAATEQTTRTLRAYRKKLSSADPISAEALEELDQELRLTAAALGDRAIRSKSMNETVLSGLLDQYSERLITMLDEKLRLTPRASASQGVDSAPPADEGSCSPTGSLSSSP